ncbi:E3 ubiquitin-protein ligase rnf213-alpha-like isoform X2 [Styela clava]
MEEISEEKTKLILHCLYIILNEFFDTKQQLLWVHFLKKKAVVSKGQAKKVEKEFKKDEYEKGISKLIDYMEKRECLIKLERSLECEDFPAENNTKVLLTHIITHKNEDLLLCFHHWHQLHHLRDTLKDSSLDSSENDDEKFRKQLVFAALHEITENKEEKTVLHAVRDMMPRFQIDSDTTKIHASLKRHAESSGLQTKPIASQNSPQTNIDDIERKNLKRSKEKDEANTDSKRSRSKGNETSDERDQENQITKQKVQDIMETRNKKKKLKKDRLKPPGETEPNLEGRKENKAQKNQNTEKKAAPNVAEEKEEQNEKEHKQITGQSTEKGEGKKSQKNEDTKKDDTNHAVRENLQNQHSAKKGYLPIKDIPEQNLDDDCIKFFVSFLPEFYHDPKNSSILIYLDCFEEKCLYKMGYHEGNDYYFCTIQRMKNWTGLSYKFCYVDTSNQQKWESLPPRAWNANRYIDVSEKADTISSYNVFIFSNQQYLWGDLWCSGMGKFLPHGFSNEHFMELLAWIQCVQSGWSCHSDWYYDYSPNVKPSQQVVETLLHSWIKSFDNRNDKQEIINHITAALELIVGLRKEKYDIATSDFLSKIFATLDTSDLDDNDISKIYDSLTEILSSCSIRLPTISDALHALFKKLEKSPSPNWLLALPLYWKFANGDAKDDKYQYCNQCSLPVIQKFDWAKVWRALCRGDLQKSLLEMVPTIKSISKRYPRIAGNFAFTLRTPEMLELIKNTDHKDLTTLFPIDIVLYRCLDFYLKGNYSKLEDESFTSYVHYQIDKMCEKKFHESCPMSVEVVKQEFIRALKYIIEFLKKKNGFKSTDTLWCLQVVTKLEKYFFETLELSEESDCHIIQKLFLELRKQILFEITNQRELYTTQIQFLGNVISTKWINPEFQTEWKKQIKDKIDALIQQKWKEEIKFMEYYSEDLGKQTLQKDIEDCFNEKAFQCAQTMLSRSRKNDGFFTRFFASDNSIKNKRLYSIFEQVFLKEYDKNKSFDLSSALQFLFQWSFSVQFYQLFYKESAIKHFREGTKVLIEQIADYFQESAIQLETAEISVKDLELILKHKTEYSLLHSTIKAAFRKESSSVDDARQEMEIFNQCGTYLKTFKKTKSVVEDFCELCFQLNNAGVVVNYEELRSQVKKYVQDCKVISLIVNDNPNNIHATNFFGISLEDLKSFEILSYIKESKIFLHMMGTKLTGLRENPFDSNLQWKQFLEFWTELKPDVFNFIKTVDEGTLSLTEVAGHFSCSRDNERETNFEVQLLYDFYRTYFVDASELDVDSDNSMDITDDVDKDDTSLKSKNAESSAETVEDKKLKNLNDRVRQIVNTFKQDEAGSAVDVLLRLRDRFRLQGNFEFIEDRKKMLTEQENVLLREVPISLEIPEVCNIPTENLKLLEAFLEEDDLIEWLQQKMNDINEVKVMCDLAMILAGENPMEVDRVSNLLGAVMGFAPLIFWPKNVSTNLDNATVDEESEQTIQDVEIKEVETNTGLKDLLEKCNQVWGNYKGDKDILTKWKVTSEQLPWFKELEQFHGSVEKLSLIRTQEINERGVYTITKKDVSALPNVENCLILVVPGKDATDSDQILSLGELCELQSKLMLIAGEAEKGQRDVNIFVENLTSIQKLTEVYVKLLESGCMLFNEWCLTVRCLSESSNITNTIKIDIKFTSDTPLISSVGTHTDLDKLTGILSKSLQGWIDYVSTKRMDFYYLNEYSIQQILHLCRQLRIFKQTKHLPAQVFALLSFVRNDFTPEDLVECLENLTETIDDSQMKVDIEAGAMELESEDDNLSDDESEDENLSDNESENGNLSEDESVDENELIEHQQVSQTELKKRLETVRSLVRDGIDENLAKAAVQSEGCDDLSKLQYWALLHDGEDDLIQGLCSTFNDAIELNQEESLELQMLASALSTSGNTLLEVIGRLRENIISTVGSNFLDSVNTICNGYLDEAIGIDLEDYLSIEQLGKCLHNLSQEGQSHRQLIPGLRHGQPNLLVCNEEDILPTVLSLYMNNIDQPLPGRSEVVICNEETTADEVERFFRRAMCSCQDNNQHLFTLAFADKLKLEVSTAVEEIFRKLSSCNEEKLNKKYQLVIVTSSQKHYLSTCFDKYLADGKWSASMSEIQDYLKMHLENKKTQMKKHDKTGLDNFLVKVVLSDRSGVGKSLYVKRVKEKLEDSVKNKLHSTTIRLLENKLDSDYIIEKLNDINRHNETQKDSVSLIHIDLTPAVQHGIKSFAFNLFVLGSIQGSRGQVWKTHPNHLYFIEMTDFGSTGKKRFSNQHILNMLPYVKCFSPQEILNGCNKNFDEQIGMDVEEFSSETFQRPYQYLLRHDNKQDLDLFAYSTPEGNQDNCIEVLLRHCCMQNPSWAQLRHFCSFLNVQLQNCEKSVFCTSPAIKQDLNGLKEFAVKFMIRMAQDFATPSLKISDSSISDNHRQGFQAHQIRRKWEESTHPYVFFNDDRKTLTFINVKINKEGHLLDDKGQITKHNIATPGLVQALKLQGMDLEKDFDSYSRQEKLIRLRRVLGVEDDYDQYDPDPSYELTTDNVLKILAIYMRFRCQIPVIIMGETGCGKTRLVEFMSKLKAGRPKANTIENVQNMITLKIHGGITVDDIHKSVKNAEEAEVMNREKHNLTTTLFYDEANTTEAIYAIKEVMCDLSIGGKSFEDSRLQLVAACNPYKKLSQEAIKKLEDSGLGYRIHTSETAHLFGNIPVRTLVYRVVALPPSMQPFVWDFGQLNDHAEKIYIEQMTKKLATDLKLNEKTISIINLVLSQSQRFMRTRKDECRYVSLRDVERCMITFKWFFEHQDVIFDHIEKEVEESCKKAQKPIPEINREIRIIIQTVGVCYHASLDDRQAFRKVLVKNLAIANVDESYINMELTACQSVFLRNIRIGDNIACNQALKENVYMMAICADMKIPLFLIGKPGSSKSLAKTIITNNMQGQTSHAPLYRNLKQIHILSYQCSALTDAAGIKSVFKQCAQLQKKQDLKTFTAVVVLDEIGLAEDSANMPLKVLHPLLERRSTDLTTVLQPDDERVGFVGISNWALDPAKMNRGIFLTRSKPTELDLKKTGKDIVQNTNLWRINEDIFESLTEAYLEVYNVVQEKEYFGLRDYYSLMKMLCHKLATVKKNEISFEDVVYAVLRNFSGGPTGVHDTIIEKVFNVFKEQSGDSTLAIPNIPLQNMICDNLSETESRFLLLLANQFSVVHLLEYCIKNNNRGFHVVFGSSFPGDHSYTEICRNINRIKVCMETGKTVILLNMTEIHESLYDALNQHFVTLGGQNYVDLGLGGHRVKSRISKDFRLIVIEKKDCVFHKYPIPLINRLEKHHFNSESLLDEASRIESEELSSWASNFTKLKKSTFVESDAFVGFHDDTISSVVLTTDFTNELECEQSYCPYKFTLLQSCSMDALLRLNNSSLCTAEVDMALEVYFRQQCHDRLVDVLNRCIEENQKLSCMEIISYSSILSENDKYVLEQQLGNIDVKPIITRWSLQLFHTQQEYSDKLDVFFNQCSKPIESCTKSVHILLVQCAQAQINSSLIACAQHCLTNKLLEFKNKSNNNSNATVVIAMLLSIERECKLGSKSEALVLQHTQEFNIIYVDELRPTDHHLAPASKFLGKSLSEVFEIGKQELELKNEEVLVNMKSLLSDSVCEAVAKVESEKKQSNRYFKRIEILKKLFLENKDANKYFCKLLLDKMVTVLLEKHEQNDNKDWIESEALNRENLQEGGTFRKTIWLCLKKHAARILACVVSVIDRDNNMDLIENESVAPWLTNMWLSMFELLDITWTDVTKSAKFTIPGSMYANKCCQLPFSFIIIDFLNTEYALESKHCRNLNEVFPGLFQNQKMYEVVVNALKSAQISVMKAFVSDLVTTLYIPGSDDANEAKLIEDSIFKMSLTAFKTARHRPEFHSGGEIAIIFLTYKELERKLQIFSTVVHACPKILENAKTWEKNQSEAFILHLEAAKDTLKILKNMAEKIDKPKECVEWLKLMRCFKNIYGSIVHDIKDDSKSWISLSLLDSLLQCVLPISHENVFFEKILKVIAPQAKLFWRGSVMSDPKSYQFLRIVGNVLKRCYQDIQLKLLIGWGDFKCHLCRSRIKSPTNLPCGHYACEGCVATILNLQDERQKCPICIQDIPEDFVPTATPLNKHQSGILQELKLNCTNFFLKYLKEICFKKQRDFSDEMSRMKQHIELILEKFVLHSRREENEEIDSTALDININTRSSILQILLSFNPTLVTDKINQDMAKLNTADFQSFVIVGLKHFEENAKGNYTRKYDKTVKYWEEILAKAKQYFQTDNFADIQTLALIKRIANIRSAVCYFVLYVNDILRETESRMDSNDALIETGLSLMTSSYTPQSVKDFFIKMGCHKFGTQWLAKLGNHAKLKVLIPPSLQQVAETSVVDYWYLLGDDFKDIKSQLFQTPIEDFERFVEDLLSDHTNSLQKLFALFSWLKEKENATIGKIVNIIKDKTQNTPLVPINEVILQYSVNHFSTFQEAHTLYQIIMISVVAATSQNGIMKGFSSIIKNLNAIENVYLPSMPEHFLFALPGDYRLDANRRNTMYVCACGYLYSIGDCTQPNQRRECPECKRSIGGLNYKLEPGNQKMNLTEESQAGYKIDSGTHAMSLAADRLSHQGAAVVQFILHACMLAGLTENCQPIFRMISVKNKTEAKKFIIEKLHKNLQDLSKALSRNVDDCVLILMRILLRIINKGAVAYPQNWSTIESRREWEKVFQNEYLLPVFQDIDTQIQDAKQLMKQAEDDEREPLNRLLNDVNSDDEIEKRFDWKHCFFWNYFSQPTPEHLLQVLSDKTEKGHGEVLKLILQTPDIYLLMHLEDILKLQHVMIERYKYNIDMQEADQRTFEDHVHQDGFDDEALIEKYIIAWNSICPQLQDFAPSLLKNYFIPITKQSSLSVALPSMRGRGQCAKLLAEYLIEIQNSFLSNCHRAMRLAERNEYADVLQLVSNDFICTKKQDLLLLINEHTKYDILTNEQEKQHLMSYNIDALEKQVQEEFVRSKKLIDKKTLPCMSYPQDVGIGVDWGRVVATTDQIPLTAKLSQDIDRLVSKCHSSEICEVVRTLTNAITFLSKVKIRSERPLCDFLEKDLKMMSAQTSMIPRSTNTCHVLSLYQRLTWHKSVMFSHRGLDPYKETLFTVNQEEIPEYIGEKVEDTFKQMDVVMLQQRINEMLINFPESNADWSLVEDLFPNIQFIDGNEDDSWYSKLPEELCCKHISDLFSLSVKFLLRN